MHENPQSNYCAFFKMKKNIIPCLKTASKFVLFIVSLPTNACSKKAAYWVVCAIGNKVSNCQQVYKVLHNLGRALTEWGSSRISWKSQRIFFWWRPFIWYHFWPDPSRCTVPLMKGNLPQSNVGSHRDMSSLNSLEVNWWMREKRFWSRI